MKILFLPIDIEVPKFSISVKNDDIKIPEKYQPYWQSFNISKLEISEVKFIVEQLPFTEVTSIYYKEQNKLALPHIDVHATMPFSPGEYDHILKNEPVGYRIVLEGNTNSVYVKCGNEFKVAKPIKVPGCYLLNSTEAMHMVVKENSIRKTIYIRGFVDPLKHQQLIEKNLKKYKDLALIDY